MGEQIGELGDLNGPQVQGKLWCTIGKQPRQFLVVIADRRIKDFKLVGVDRQNPAFLLIRLPGPDSILNLLGTSVQKQAAADRYLIADPQDVHLNRMSVDPRAVRAFQVGQNDTAAVFLDFGVKAAHPFIVQLNSIVFFATDRDRRLNVAQDTPTFHSLQYLKCEHGHVRLSRSKNG